MRDFDRPLEPIGTQDASALGSIMANDHWIPALVLCSTAARARETWEAVQGKLPEGSRTLFLEDLYNTDAAGYLSIIQASGAEASLMVVGHNPMIEDVALALAAPDDALAEQIRRSGFPTAGLAVIDFEEEVAQIRPGHGRVVEIRKPDAR